MHRADKLNFIEQRRGGSILSLVEAGTYPAGGASSHPRVPLYLKHDDGIKLEVDFEPHNWLPEDADIQGVVASIVAREGDELSEWNGISVGDPIQFKQTHLFQKNELFI